MLRDVDEFSTCINSTARHEQPLIGLEICKGDRKVYYRAMLNLLKFHRRCIAEGMGFVEQEGLMRTPRGYLQYFDATGVVKETFVGTIAGLALGQKDCDPYKPIAGIVRENGMVKISARCSKLLFLKGLNLARAIRSAAKAVGGEGGGHAVACGAQVEEGKIQEFLQEFENGIISELSLSSVPRV
jgi:RecJ-like exonuclease